jgi:hypothetical protein
MTNGNTDDLRWAEYQRQLLSSEDCETKAGLVARIGTEVSKWLKEGAIFSVLHEREEYIPLFQFVADVPIPIVRQIVTLMAPKASRWEIFGWFCQANSWSCRGLKPKDLLLEDPETVLEATRHEVAEQWF